MRAGLGWRVLAFSRRGRLDRRYGRHRGVVPDLAIASYVAPGPIGALRRRRPILAWTAFERTRVGAGARSSSCSG